MNKVDEQMISELRTDHNYAAVLEAEENRDVAIIELGSSLGFNNRDVRCLLARRKDSIRWVYYIENSIIGDKEDKEICMSDIDLSDIGLDSKPKSLPYAYGQILAQLIAQDLKLTKPRSLRTMMQSDDFIEGFTETVNSRLREMTKVKTA